MKKEIAVNITKQAVDKAKELVSLDNSSIGLRIEIKKGGCSGMTYDVVCMQKVLMSKMRL